MFDPVFDSGDACGPGDASVVVFAVFAANLADNLATDSERLVVVERWLERSLLRKESERATLAPPPVATAADDEVFDIVSSFSLSASCLLPLVVSLVCWCQNGVIRKQ